MKKLIYMPFTFLIALFIFYLPVRADNKDIEVNLTEQYTNCTFWINSLNGDEWDVSIDSPDGDEYICEYDLEKNSYYCDFETVCEGIYVVHILSDFAIGKTTVTIKSTVPKTSEFDDKNVIVAKSVAGLQIYVKDNKVVVEWTDDSCGTLCIKIFDTDTFLVLANDKSDDKYYECEFSDTVKKVTVSVVPASSEKIEAAIHTVTLDANYKPKGSVTFPEFTKTNNIEYTCNVLLDCSQQVGVVVNDSQVVKFTAFGSGTNPITFNLVEGDNNIKVYIKDDNGSMKSLTTDVFCDTVPPELKIAQEYDGLVTANTSIQIEGVVTNHAKLLVNEVEQDVSDNGYFSCDFGLMDGKNIINIVALDNVGNKISYDATITKGKTSGKRSLIVNVLTIMFYAVVLFFGVKFGPRITDKLFGKKSVGEGSKDEKDENSKK